jgi:hypothetical protein
MYRFNNQQKHCQQLTTTQIYLVYNQDRRDTQDFAYHHTRTCARRVLTFVVSETLTLLTLTQRVAIDFMTCIHVCTCVE